MGEWKTATVGDFFELITGYAFKSKEFKDFGVPVIKIKNVKAGEFSTHEFSYVDERYLEERKNKIAQRDDLLISMSGNRHDGSPETWVGKVCRFNEDTPYLINQRVGALRLKKHKPADLRYFGFLLSGMPYQERFIAIATSSGGQANLSPNQILGAPIQYPDVVKQRRIGELLGALDDKIDLNRRMNETLEAMARAIFKDWFVDFGPTRTKAARRDHPTDPKYDRPPYLAPDLWDLFPDALDDEDKPVGWTFDTLSRLAVTNPESWTARNHPPTVEYLDLSNTKWGNIEATTLLDWEAAPSRARRIAKAGDALVGTTRPGNGSFAYISRDGLTVSTGFAVLSPRSAKYRDAVYLAATSAENIERLANLAEGHGGAYPAVKPNEVSDTAIVFPGDEVLAAFADLASPIRERIEHAKAESRTLAQTRDLLLPKLMSGEIRVGEAEKAVEAVA